MKQIHKLAESMLSGTMPTWKLIFKNQIEIYIVRSMYISNSLSNIRERNKAFEYIFTCRISFLNLLYIINTTINCNQTARLIKIYTKEVI